MVQSFFHFLLLTNGLLSNERNLVISSGEVADCNQLNSLTWIDPLSKRHLVFRWIKRERSVRASGSALGCAESVGSGGGR